MTKVIAIHGGSPLSLRLLFVGVNCDASMLLRQAEQDIARVHSHRRIRNCDRNEDVIVTPEGRYGMRSWSGRQRANYGIGIAVYDTECRVAAELAGSIVIIVAGVVPDLVGSPGVSYVGDRLAIHGAQNQQRF